MLPPPLVPEILYQVHPETLLYGTLKHMILAIDTFHLASGALTGYSRKPSPELKRGLFSGRVGNIRLVLPVETVFQSLMCSQPTPEIWFGFTHASREEYRWEDHGSLGAVSSYFQTTAMGLFTLFYEGFWQFVWRSASHDRAKLHPVWAFARVIRNACVHRGRINIQDQNFQPVTWCGVTLGRKDHDELLSNIILFPDFILLMIWMESALHDLDYKEIRNFET